jgi:hypothetical protein
MRQTRVTGKGEFHIGSAYVDAIRFWAGLTDYKHHELADEGGFNGVQQTFTNKDLEVRVETQFMPVALPFGVLTSAAGVQGNHQFLTSPGREGGLENQFDVVRASFTSDGNVPRIPPVRLGGGLYWRDANWLARANLLHAFAQNDIAQTGETPTKGLQSPARRIELRHEIRAEQSVGKRDDPRPRRQQPSE